MKAKKVRIAGILFESLVNGPGIRRVIFAQGCRHNCRGCFNQHTHSFQGGKLMDMDEILKDIFNNPMLSGVTFSGGDPFEQSEEFAYMAAKIREKGLNVWCYTGYTFEKLIENKDNNHGWNQLLSSIDVLVDGKFEENKKRSDIRYRGSSNQRIIDVKKTLSSGKIVAINYDDDLLEEVDDYEETHYRDNCKCDA